MTRFAVIIAALLAPTFANAQLVLNEATAIGVNGEYIEIGGPSKPYEGFDYGILPHSGNNNSPVDPTTPGNPFPDVDAGQMGVQSMLPNGWVGTTGFGRIQGNGGDWIELVVTEDCADLRGYWLYWENDDDQDGTLGEPGEFGYVRLSNDPIWSNLRAGTIITISEDIIADEIRDRYPAITEGTPVTHDTGFDFDMSTNTSFDPIGVATPATTDPNNYFHPGDWHMHFRVDEAITQNANLDTQYFLAGSNIKIDNDDWRHFIFGPGNPGADPNTRFPDVVTDLVQGPIGETEFEWGAGTGGGGVNNQEVISLNFDPASGLDSSGYEDIDFSSFGRPNMFNISTAEVTLDGVQDFSGLRAWVRLVKDGDTDFDKDVDFDDAQTQLGNMTGPENSTTIPWSQGSFDGDGDNDVADFARLQACFGL